MISITYDQKLKSRCPVTGVTRMKLQRIKKTDLDELIIT